MSFAFLDPGMIADDRLKLHLSATEPADKSIWQAPAYRFEIQLIETGQRIGHLNFRIGDGVLLTHYAGMIGYGIDEAYRGNRYAERACRLVFPFVARHRIDLLWITCNPDNIPSRKTLERLGATFVEIVSVPEDYPVIQGMARLKCRYRVKMEQATNGHLVPSPVTPGED
jgi:predicted acetyltransferase